MTSSHASQVISSILRLREDAGVGAEHVDAADAFATSAKAPRERCLVGDIAGDAEGTVADLGRRRRALVLVARHRSATFAPAFANTRAMPLPMPFAAAGDDDRAACDGMRHVSLPVWLLARLERAVNSSIAPRQKRKRKRPRRA